LAEGVAHDRAGFQADEIPAEVVPRRVPWAAVDVGVDAARRDVAESERRAPERTELRERREPRRKAGERDERVFGWLRCRRAYAQADAIRAAAPRGDATHARRLVDDDRREGAA